MAIKLSPYAVSSIMCRKGVWDVGRDQSELPKILLKWRGARCFFIEYLGPGVLFDQASEILQARINRRSRIRNFVLAAIGVLVGALSLVNAFWN